MLAKRKQGFKTYKYKLTEVDYLHLPTVCRHISVLRSHHLVSRRQGIVKGVGNRLTIYVLLILLHAAGVVHHHVQAT